MTSLLSVVKVVIQWQIFFWLSNVAAIKLTKEQLDTIRSFLELEMDSGPIAKQVKANGIIISSHCTVIIRVMMEKGYLNQFKRK